MVESTVLHLCDKNDEVWVNLSVDSVEMIVTNTVLVTRKRWEESDYIS